MTGDFPLWLMIVGLIAGAALTWLVMAETTRRDEEIGDRELEAEAAWIASTLDDPLVDAGVASHVLRAHRRYLGFPPPDALVEPEELVGTEGGAGDMPVPTLTGDRPAS